MVIINNLKEFWKSEERKAHITGWDFSYIRNRFESEENSLPWDISDVIHRYKHDTDFLLDIDTGGGEFLLSLGHPYYLTSATEGFQPNVVLCRKKFGILGIEFHEMTDYSSMPFSDERFDIIINRHGNYNAKEISRILKPNGIFITQQVGEDNDRELIQRLIPDSVRQFKGHNLSNCIKDFENTGFSILESNEAYCPIRFYDTGALVWFAKIIEWEFTGFSVDKCFKQLIETENEIKKNGFVSGRIHRFYVVARK